MYATVINVLKKIFRRDQLFKYGFNLSPMYRRSVGRVTNVSKDLLVVHVEIPLNFKNRNYVGSIFGGSLFSATDPIFMIQLIHILREKYIVWDKSARINYKRPARSKAHAIFEFTEKEIDTIKLQLNESEKMDIVKRVNIISEKGEVFAELEKTIFICTKEYYKHKILSKKTAYSN